MNSLKCDAILPSAAMRPRRISRNNFVPTGLALSFLMENATETRGVPTLRSPNNNQSRSLLGTRTLD
jgi:hypothetical protein